MVDKYCASNERVSKPTTSNERTPTTKETQMDDKYIRYKPEYKH
ncbi:20596_t:CDS:1, partial [Gigaspora rosea]